MKYIITVFLSITITTTNFSQSLKPYLLGVTTNEGVETIQQKLVQVLSDQNFEVLGSYTPAADNNRRSVVVTHPELKKAVSQIGGLRGFAGTLRIGITQEGSTEMITYTNPFYWGNAYFQKDFSDVKPRYEKVNNAFIEVMKQLGPYQGTAFGSEKGIEPDDLQDYQYMFGMPEFDDTRVVGEFDSYAEAVSSIDKNLQNGVSNASLVYKFELKDSNLALYGIGFSGDDGEADFLPTIDISNPKHTAFLPYEILVKDSEVHMLHGRFRIALSFPDLTMGTFTKIMSTPGDIEELMEEVAKNNN